MNHIAFAAPSRQRTEMTILMGQDHRSLVLKIPCSHLARAAIDPQSIGALGIG